jgi:stage II sporulation protein AA (anti-sigma F factor antagonist)
VNSPPTNGTIPLGGELDLGNADEVGQELDAAVMQVSSTVVCLDCKGLEFIDSSGLAMLLRIDAGLRQQGRSLLLLQVPKRLQRVFTLTAVDFLIGSTAP